MAFKHAILGLLTAGPRHGYELKTAFQEGLSKKDPLNVGQVYTALDRLAREGFVARETVGQRSRPDKKVYDLTPAGRTELERWLDSPSPPNLDLRNETFLKLMVAHRVEGADPRVVIETEREACMNRLSQVEAARPATEETGSRLQLELAALRLDAFLRWLDVCERRLCEETEP